MIDIKTDEWIGKYLMQITDLPQTRYLLLLAAGYTKRQAVAKAMIPQYLVDDAERQWEMMR